MLQLQIINVDVLDIFSGTIEPCVTVEIAEGIVQMIRTGSSDSSAAQIIDGAGKILLPGLIDAHVHLCLDSTEDALDNYMYEDREITFAKMIHHLKVSLQAGVTTVRDAGGPLELMERLKKSALGPTYSDVVFSGPAITTPRGHGYYFGFEVADDEDLLEVLEIINEQFDYFKVMGSGGGLTKGSAPEKLQFSERKLRIIGDFARSKNKKAAIHLHSSAGIHLALACGFDSIEHGSFAESGEIDAIKQYGGYYVPTLVPGEYTFEALRGRDIDIEDKKSRLFSREKAVLLCFERGVNLVAGTDAGIPYTPHGRVCDEIIYFNRLGISPLVALQAATSTAARLLNLDDQIGAVQEGYQADLILTDENPLENLKTLKKPHTVIKKGEIVPQ